MLLLYDVLVQRNTYIHVYDNKAIQQEKYEVIMKAKRHYNTIVLKDPPLEMHRVNILITSGTINC